MTISLNENISQVVLNWKMDFILTVLVIVAGVIFLFFRSSNNAKQKPGVIPGRRGIPILGETASLLAATNSTKGVYDFVKVRRLRYGNWFKTRIMGKTHVFIPSVEGAKTVYKNDFVLFKKKYMKSMGDLIGKKSLLAAPKSSHEKLKHLLFEPFSMNSIAQFVPKFDSIVSTKLKELERNGKSFPMLGFTMKTGFDVICDMLMSITDAGLLEEMEKDCIAVYDAMLSFPIMIPGTPYYRGIKARKRMMERFKAIMSDRRRGKTSSEDFLQSMLRRDSYPAHEKLDDEEILDNLLSSLLSGRNTTATAMMWSVKFLSDNPKVQDKLREEQLSIKREIPNGAMLTYENLKKMCYTSKVIKETLRMSNVILWYPRVASDNCTIDGFQIKKGWHVNIDATHIHYDPAIHKDPMRFNPSRFDEIPKPYTFMPFGSGPRACLGVNMAKVTMLVFMHRLTSGYTWTLDDNDPSLECKGCIPKLKNGCPITLRAISSIHGQEI